MTSAFLLLGGNIGEANSILRKVRSLWNSSWGEILSESKVFTSKAWGVEDAEVRSLYWNQAWKLETKLSLESLLMHTQSIEMHFERNKDFQYDDRECDIDILLFGNQAYKSKQLSIPHSKLHEREFALQCLFDIDETILIPNKGSVKEVLENLRARKTEGG